MFEVLEVDFVVADDLVEFLSDHEFLDVDSLEAGDDLNHGIADFEEFFEVGEEFGGFVGIDEFELDHLGFDELNGGFDVLVVVDLGFEPFVQDVHAVFGVFLLFEEVLSLNKIGKWVLCGWWSGGRLRWGRSW